MTLALIVLGVALAISGVAAFYSIVGLMAIFSASSGSIAIMGSVLEVGKLATASWLYQNWKKIPKLLKYYLTGAVVILMFITSMGIFGYLSKAHIEQTTIASDFTIQVKEKYVGKKSIVDCTDNELKTILHELRRTYDKRNKNGTNRLGNKAGKKVVTKSQ